eukprot:CAMPEP_0202978096 /NCGR_PEP_ID=MMETSP1396-20130829/84639_1 /ASSEMBLY_ACC=CAM_ASM_000872 /TAXON_ID= /ORGANISM="Pseudokeronopsis sp., Strain Brazil" /LENGTH=504 /DNA_ID=CAMNT_0049716965 /DNA_START=1133 /DNA_END=2646 /DNA_ORIENTATION=-
MKLFKEVVAEIDPLSKAAYRVDEWFMEEGPRPQDLYWKNLIHDHQYRISRKLIVAMFLIIFGFLLVFPFRYMVVFFPIYQKKETAADGTKFTVVYNQELSVFQAFLPYFFLSIYVYGVNYLLLPFLIFNQKKETADDGTKFTVVYNQELSVFQAFLPYFFLSIYVYGVNYLLLPFLIFKLNFYESLHKYSLREFVLMNKLYIYMVFNTVFLPGFSLTIILRFVQLLAFPKLAEPAPEFLQAIDQFCDSFINFDPFYTMDFFIYFMLTLLMFTVIFQAFYVFPHVLDRNHPGRVVEEVKKRTQGYSGRVPFKEWFFSFDYQVPFVTAVFTITLTYSTTEPLILVVAFIFFVIKYFFDFNQRILLRRDYFSQDLRHSNNTLRSSIVKYMFCSIVLYMTVSCLVFNSSSETKTVMIIYIGLTVLAFALCVFFWRKWKLVNKPQIGNIFHEAEVENNRERFDLRRLSDMYRHPIEKLYPCAASKEEAKSIEYHLNHVAGLIAGEDDGG